MFYNCNFMNLTVFSFIGTSKATQVYNLILSSQQSLCCHAASLHRFHSDGQSKLIRNTVKVKQRKNLFLLYTFKTVNSYDLSSRLVSVSISVKDFANGMEKTSPGSNTVSYARQSTCIKDNNIAPPGLQVH